MSSPGRTITAFALCLVTLVTGGLGLGSRKVLCMDGDGHYAIEAAGHARHTGCHADNAHAEAHGVSHADDDVSDVSYGLDGRHDAACSDTALTSLNVQRQSAGMGARFLQPVSELPAWTIAVPPSASPLALRRLGSGRSTDPPPRAELHSLRAIILLS